MRLAVIGDTQHYRDEQGRLCALEPVVNQLDRWATLFDEIVLCAPLDPGPPPAGFAPYRSTNLSIDPIRRGGGNTVLAKLGMLRHIGPWAWQTRRVARSVDAVHLRCPCNIGLVALISTWRAGCRRYAMYAGVWQPYAGQPLSYRLQRWLLASRHFGGPVNVYADPDPSRSHLEPFFSPSFSTADWEAATPTADRKIERIRSGAELRPLRLVSVGRLTPNKNQRTIIDAVGRLRDSGVEVRLDLYGDGPCRPELEARVTELRLGDVVSFHGSVDHGEVMAAFADADLNLLSTRQEGYGKVLLEGMVHAVVPIFGASPVSGEISGHGTRGLVFDVDRPDEMEGHVQALLGDRARWADVASAARKYATTVTLDTFEDRVRQMLSEHWGVALPTSAPPER